MEDRLLLSTITVTGAGDTIDPLDGVVTLREAITAANTNAASGDAPAGTVGLDTIAFNIPGAGVHTITLATALPSITDPIVIDGTTQPGSSANTLAVGDNAVLNIEINGANIALNFAGLRIDAGASGSTIRGLVINRFAALGSAAVEVFNSTNNTIVGNFLGTDPTGSTALGNNIGVAVRGENNLIGSPAPADRNLISGNGNGISLTNTGSALNTVQGNYIGVTAAGNADLGNTNIGILLRGVFQGAMQGGTLIGGATSTPGAEAGNVISGNDGLAGIKFDNLSDTVLGPVTIQGNIIGLGADGTTVVGNTGPGIEAITDLDSTNGAVLIGGPGASTRNIISGNNTGIVYSDAVATVQGNYFGTDVTGTLDRGNTFYAIEIVGDRRDANNPAATTMTIGGAGLDEGNLISGNDAGGVSIRNANAVIQGNRIGTQADGTSPLGNTGEGVRVYNVLADAQLQVDIGGEADGAGNIIAYNNLGVTTSVTVVKILRNSLFSNLNSGIILTGAALNDAPPPPVLTAATTTSITGTASAPGDTTLRLEFFATPGEPNEGKTFLGWMEVTTDAANSASFTFSPAGGVPAGQSITATATSGFGTSTFSQAIVLPTPGTADVGVTIVALPNPVPAGDDLTYTITVSNIGSVAALDVALSNAIPANTTFVSFVAPAGWRVTTPAVGGSGTVTANIDSQAAGSATFTLIVRVAVGTAAGTTITSTASVSAEGTDADPDNNSATATVTVSTPTPPVEGVADLAVMMTVSAGQLIAGTNFTYIIDTLNIGPNPGTGVILTDVLPAGLTFVSSSLGTYDSATRTLTVEFGDLGVGADPTVTIIVRADAAGNFTNVAHIQGQETDPNPANNTASSTVVVTAAPPAVVGPVVVLVRRDGFHMMPTSIAVTFSADMDPTRAQNAANYRLQAPGQGLVRVGSVTYDPLSRSVTIHPIRRLNIHYPFTLTINGQAPDGLSDASGNFLDGAGNGESGTDYQANVLWYGAATRVTPIQPPTGRAPLRTPIRAPLRAPMSTRAMPRFPALRNVMARTRMR